MKSKLLLMALFAIFAGQKSYAQANCTTPPNCILNHGTDVSGGNGSPWGALVNAPGHMVPHWSVFLGTPIFGPGWSTSSGIQMVSDASNGEGVFTCYNFQSGKTYDVCFWARNTTTENRGELIVEAYNSTTSTGQIIKNGTYYQPAAPPTGPGGANGLVKVQVTFTASQNFNQLRFYTNWTNGYPNPSNPYSVSFDDPQVVEVPVVTANSPTINECGSTTLSASSSNPLTVTWSPAAGLSSTSGTSVTARPCSTTTYTATYRSSTCGFSCENTRNVTVTVQSSTSATANPSTINPCQSSTLTASSTNPMSVTWSPSTGLSSTTGNVVTASPCSTTTYTAQFYCALTGCFYQKQVTVYVQPSGSIINNSAIIPCRGPISMQYSGNPCPNSTYQWKGPQGNILSTTSSFSMPSSARADEGTFTLTITSPGGCVSTYHEVVQMTGCCAVSADFEVEGDHPLRFINNTTVNGNPAIQGDWHWDFGDGTTSGIRNPAHMFPLMQDFEVCLTAVVSDGLSTCCDKVCRDVTIPDRRDCEPKAAFGYRVTNAALHEVQLLDMSAGWVNACNWQWHVNGIPVSTAQHPSVIFGPPNFPPTPGTYEVCLWVEYCDHNGNPTCSDQWCEDIVIP